MASETPAQLQQQQQHASNPAVELASAAAAALPVSNSLAAAAAAADPAPAEKHAVSSADAKAPPAAAAAAQPGASSVTAAPVAHAVEGATTPEQHTTHAPATAPPAPVAAAPSATAPTAPHAQPAAPPLSASAAMPAPHSVSLYVGDLHPDLTEANLFEIFQALGPVQSIRVCRDVVTRRSLGYAYINFHNTADAERALETMNYYSSPITKNKPLRMMWMIRDPSSRRSGAGNIFVKSLDKDIDNKTLYDTFSQFGTILSCKVATDDSGQSLGHGFVHFETQEAAQAAIDKVNGKLLAGRKVYVGKFLNKREREAAGQVNKMFTNVYVKNIEEEKCNEECVRDLFSQFGEITSVHIATNDDDTPRGFAFINFASPEMAKRAVEEMNEKEFGTKRLTVCPAQKKSVREAELRNKYEMLRAERSQKYQGINLYVKNLSDDVDDDRLRAEFSPYGTITSAKVMRDDKGYSKGFGFVCFTQPEEATKAVTELNGRMMGLKPIYVALAQRKEVRRAQLEAQRAMNRMSPGGMAGGAMYAQAPAYMYPQAMANMGQVAGAMGAATGGRNGAPMQYIAAVGRGGGAGAFGRGNAAAMQQYMAMGRGQAGVGPVMNMHAFPMGAGRQPRQNRQRGGGPNAAAAAAAAGGMVGVRGGGVGRGVGGGANGVGHAVTATAVGPGGYNKYAGGARNGNVGGPANGQAVAGVGPSNGGVGVGVSAAGGGAGGGGGAPQAGSGVAQEPLTIEMLANATAVQQKQMLGERLYPLITEMQPRLSGKITGMLLDMENSDLLHLLDSPETLSERVEEAVAVLREHAAASSGEGGAGAGGQA
ncbi:Polyadenylate-binding protein, cytoplasmic and nuclear [Gracilariopsis chorda]|uniref:Polyadenylate-binding protein n=1 Tax=Gracilariopsis chorda TaxID=448386 RepID=A0A2V3IGN8_9FLOR|nr:Polyadenylate-binding protein, cytoplasmic and nuclear [Gracilariopsis chorda]|eukprot:PXF41254.1 Polyadenylate-binding protein, cytoplasmic and nuclear [Gracilariopsis chorda]